MKREKKKKQRYDKVDSDFGNMESLFAEAGFHDTQAEATIADQGESGQVASPDVPQWTAYRIRKERKGRGGKTVTIVIGLSPDNEVLKQLAQELKKALGCGAHVEENQIVLQGDIEERVRAWIASRV